MDILPRPPSPYYTADHDAFRDQMRRFVDREIAPYVDQWDEAGEFPRELYKKAAALGLLQMGYPEEYGGVSTDGFYRIIVSEELARAGCGGHCGRPPPRRHAAHVCEPKRWRERGVLNV